MVLKLSPYLKRHGYRSSEGAVLARALQPLSQAIHVSFPLLSPLWTSRLCTCCTFLLYLLTASRSALSILAAVKHYLMHWANLSMRSCTHMICISAACRHYLNHEPWDAAMPHLTFPNIKIDFKQSRSNTMTTYPYHHADPNKSHSSWVWLVSTTSELSIHLFEKEALSLTTLSNFIYRLPSCSSLQTKQHFKWLDYTWFSPTLTHDRMVYRPQKPSLNPTSHPQRLHMKVHIISTKKIYRTRFGQRCDAADFCLYFRDTIAPPFALNVRLIFSFQDKE